MLAPARMADSSKASWAGSAPSASSPPGRPPGPSAPAGLPIPAVGRDPVMHAAGRPALGRGGHEEHPPGTPPRHREHHEPLAERHQPLPPRRLAPGSGDHDLLQEARPGGVDGGQLQLLLGPEQHVHAALRHSRWPRPAARWTAPPAPPPWPAWPPALISPLDRSPAPAAAPRSRPSSSPPLFPSSVHLRRTIVYPQLL